MRWLNHWRLKSRDPKIREQAINNLCHSAGIGEIRLFTLALHDEDAGVRKAACRAIGVLRETKALACIESLLAWLKNPDLRLRASAAEALELLGWTPSNSEERVLKAIALGNFEQISANEETAVELLLFNLKTGPAHVRVAIAETFERFQSRIEDPRMVEQLINLLNDPDFTVRVAALHALSKANDERRISPLLKLLKNESPHVRESAVEAIGKSGHPELMPHILPLLKDAKFEVRVAAITALGNLKNPEALDPIISMLKDADADVRKSAVDSLMHLRDKRAVKALIATLIDKESIVRHGAANALQVVNFQWRISEEAQKAIPVLEAGLKDEEYWVREAAAKALNRIRNL